MDVPRVDRLLAGVLACTTVSALVIVSPTAPSAQAASSSVTASPADLAAGIWAMPALPQSYQRSYFTSLSSTSRDWRGCNLLQRALISAALTRPRISRGCSMSGGSWRLTADGSIVTGAANVRVLPVLTLDQAWAQGAYAWTSNERHAFANTFPTARSSTPSSRSSAAVRDCAITRTSSTVLGCAYAVVPSESTYGASSLLTLLSDEPDAVDCSLASTIVATVTAWDLALPAPARSTLARATASCADDITIVRARKAANHQRVFEDNPLLPGSSMLTGTAELLTAPSGDPVPSDFFGLHVLPGSGEPTIPYGLLRTWDADLGWERIEPRRGKYTWTALDRAVNDAAAAHRKLVYVLGPTPWWAADAPTDPPTRMSDLAEFVRALTNRYGDRLFAIEMWNEANLKGYFSGSPRTLAVMTKTVKDTVDKTGTATLVIAPSTTTRMTALLHRWFPTFLRELKRLDWPVDAFALHSYPRPAGGPDEQAAEIVLAKSIIQSSGAPDLPIYDTEVNYGLGGLDLPKVDINPPKAGAYIAQTFLEALRLGMSSVAWYAWSPRTYPLLGLQTHPGTTDTNASWTALNHLIVGASFVGCAEQDIAILCGFERDGVRFGIAYAPSGVDSTVTVPPAWTRSCTLSGGCIPISAGQVTVGLAPTVLRP